MWRLRRKTERGWHDSEEAKVLCDLLNKLERELAEARGQRDEWRNEHDRVVREYQHRLSSLATAALAASNYPEPETTKQP